MLIGQNVRNAIINSRFDYWQRNTTDTFAAAGTTAARYVADRWRVISVPNGGTSAAMVVSRQAFTAGQTEVPNAPVYFLRVTNSTVGTSLGTLSNHGMDQGIEDVNTLAGKKVTVSFYARSSISGQKISASLNRNFGSGGSSPDQISGYGLFDLTSAFQRFSFSLTLPSVSGKTIGLGSYLGIRINFQSGSSEAALYGGTAFPFAGTGTIDVANVMINEGELSDYEMAGRTIADELNLCRRYCQSVINTSGGNQATGLVGLCHQSTTQLQLLVRFGTPMRATPTTGLSGTNPFIVGGGVNTSISGALGAGTSLQERDVTDFIQVLTTTSAMTVGNWYRLEFPGGSTAGSRILFDAEF